MGWILQSETVVETTHGTIVLGAALGLPPKPGRFDIIAENIDPIPGTAEGPYICLGVICTDPTNPPSSGIHTIWVAWEQQQVPPGTPFGDGQWYQWNGIGNTIPADSGGYSHTAILWDVAEFEVFLNGTGFDPAGMAVSITCRYFEWDTGEIAAYDALPLNAGMAVPDPVTAVPGLEDARLITLEWEYAGNTHDGFAIFDISDPSFPSPVALLADPDIRNYAFPAAYSRAVDQQFAVGAYNAVEKSDITSTVLAHLEIVLTPVAGALPIARLGEPYGVLFQASGGFGGYTFEELGGIIPTGLNFNPATGLLSGTPTEVYPIPGSDWPLTVVAHGTDIADSPNQAYTLKVIETTFSWDITPASGEVEAGQIIVVVTEKASELEYTMKFDDKIVPLTPKIVSETEVWLEVPYPPTDECSVALSSCLICADAVNSCADDIESEECQEAMEACIACLEAALESIEAAEACNEAQPPTVSPPVVVIVVNGRQFSGSVPLGIFTIIESEGSGLYRFVIGETHDTLYTAERDGTTYDVKIPNPGGKTGFFRS
jgi:hypothetical protein